MKIKFINDEYIIKCIRCNLIIKSKLKHQIKLNYKLHQINCNGIKRKETNTA